MKNILITGCSSGFGFDAAKFLSKKGHHVYASMRNVRSSNAEVASELKQYANDNHYKMDIVDIDVTSDESISATMSGLPPMDVLINNAGKGYGGPIEAFTGEQCLAQMDLNIVGPFRMAKAVLPGMRSKGAGLIIQVSSIAGRCAFPGFGIYHASKWGLEGLSESLRYELAPLGIDVVLVEPGPFATNFFGGIEGAKDEDVAATYKHVGEFSDGFANNVESMFNDDNAPTDPMIIVRIFEKLINSPNGKRPLRTIGGLDFGMQALNDTVEPIRKAGLEAMGLSDCDGPQS